MKFENTEVWGFQHALRGMRNPKESWDKSDSDFSDGCYIDDGNTKLACENCMYFAGFGKPCIPKIGENDMKLALALIKGGSEHRKFLRQIFVSVDITAPLYWWKEFDTYKVGTVANSTSTMHKLASTPITLDCFEIDDYNPTPFSALETNVFHIINNYFIPLLETLRSNYNATKDKKVWKELIRWLPESWLQKRTVTMNYENLLAICSKGQRRFHKLNEWSGQDNPKVPNFISWVRSLPYGKEFIFYDENTKK